MADEQQPPSFDDFDARLRKIREQQDRDAPKPGAPAPKMNFGSGLQAGIEVIAGVAFGLILGYALDRWLETSPLFLIVFFMLGSAAGVLNAYRFMRRMLNRPDAG